MCEVFKEVGCLYFNPRTPCGVRRWIRLLLPGTTNFNPRAPCGARLCVRHAGDPARRFQSTRPVWGATTASVSIFASPCISIHAPRVGRDDSQAMSVGLLYDFNPRAPCGARLYYARMAVATPTISIHAPRVGRDFFVHLFAPNECNFNPRAPCGARPGPCHPRSCGGKISIHAPRLGRDPVTRHYHCILPYFNPRAPCGARRDGGVVPMNIN